MASARDLALQRPDMRGQQPEEAERIAFGLGEGGAPVGQGIGEQRAGCGMEGGGDMPYPSSRSES